MGNRVELVFFEFIFIFRSVVFYNINMGFTFFQPRTSDSLAAYTKASKIYNIYCIQITFLYNINILRNGGQSRYKGINYVCGKLCYIDKTKYLYHSSCVLLIIFKKKTIFRRKFQGCLGPPNSKLALPVFLMNK